MFSSDQFFYGDIGCRPKKMLVQQPLVILTKFGSLIIR